jgi:Ni,Fe-hydrogenase maturation factor
MVHTNLRRLASRLASLIKSSRKVDVQSVMTIVEELRVLLNSAEEAILIVADIVKFELEIMKESQDVSSRMRDAR